MKCTILWLSLACQHKPICHQRGIAKCHKSEKFMMFFEQFPWTMLVFETILSFSASMGQNTALSICSRLFIFLGFWTSTHVYQEVIATFWLNNHIYDCHIREQPHILNDGQRAICEVVFYSLDNDRQVSFILDWHQNFFGRIEWFQN